MEHLSDPVLPPLPYASISDASSVYFKEYTAQHRGALVVIAAVVILLGVWYARSGSVTFEGMFGYFALIAMLIVGFTASVRSRGASMFYESIARAWKWTFTSSWLVSDFHGSLVQVGHSHRLSNILFDNPVHPVRTIGTIQYSIGSGKSEQTYTNGFACVVVGVPLPHVLLTVDKDRFDNHILSAVGGLVSVRLEDTFEDYFGLYVEPGLELEALQLFSEELLKMMLEQWPGYSFECIGGELYVYTEGQIETKKKMAELSSLLEYLLGLRPRLTAMRGSVIAMHQAVKSAD